MPRNSTSAGPALRKPARTSGGKPVPRRVAAKPAGSKAVTKLKTVTRVKPVPKVKATSKVKTAQKQKAATKQKANAGQQELMVADWEEESDTLDVIPGDEDMLDKPIANHAADAEARRRIEMLREERMLAEALSEVFDL